MVGLLLINFGCATGAATVRYFFMIADPLFLLDMRRLGCWGGVGGNRTSFRSGPGLVQKKFVFKNPESQFFFFFLKKPETGKTRFSKPENRVKLNPWSVRFFPPSLKVSIRPELNTFLRGGGERENKKKVNLLSPTFTIRRLSDESTSTGDVTQHTEHHRIRK